MKNSLGLLAVLVFFLNCNGGQNTSKEKQQHRNVNLEEVEKEVWEAIEARFITWKENDFEQHMNFYHADWKRWASGRNELITKEDFAQFWDSMKKEEDCLELSLNPEKLEVFNNGKCAIAHYTHTEIFRYHGANMPDGRSDGNIYKGTLRWSDFLIRENGRWLVIGGHRDMSMPEGKLRQIDY